MRLTRNDTMTSLVQAKLKLAQTDYSNLELQARPFPSYLSYHNILNPQILKAGFKSLAWLLARFLAMMTHVMRKCQSNLVDLHCITNEILCLFRSIKGVCGNPHTLSWASDLTRGALLTRRGS